MPARGKRRSRRLEQVAADRAGLIPRQQAKLDWHRSRQSMGRLALALALG